ncbi:MAG: hypothetical protein ABFD69_15615 [Candidatus Sumerlaeia bacterium]
MANRLKPIDFTQVQTGSIRKRTYRLSADMLARMPRPTESLQNFFLGLPRVGESAALLGAAELLAQTALAHGPMLWVVDGRVMELGLSSLLVYLMQRELVQCLVMNGEAAVRDYELAFHGQTVEDVAEGLSDGQLGLTRETGEGINTILNEGVKRGFSLGECVGRGILDRQPRHFAQSLLATGAARLVPTTVHVSLGADGFQRYPGADGAMIGKGSLKDAQNLSSFIASLTPGALIVCLHHDYALNQVLLHALALARNLNDTLKGINYLSLGEAEPFPVELPPLGRAMRLNGPLELMLPLLLGALFCLVE